VLDLYAIRDNEKEVKNIIVMREAMKRAIAGNRRCSENARRK